MKLRGFLLAMILCTLCTGQARALEYSVDAPEDYLFGRPTSEDTIYEQEPSQESKRNPAKRLRLEAEEQGSEWSSRPWAGTEWSGLCDDVDRSKNTALVAPGFGTPTSYLPGSGEALTPNLIPGALEGGGLVSSVGSVNYPTVSTPVDTDNAFTWSSTKFTDVTEDLYYSGGHLGS